MAIKKRITYEKAVEKENKCRYAPRREAVVGEAHDELAPVEREGPGRVEVLAAVVGWEAHSQVGRAVEADQLRHDGPVHVPRAHLRCDLDLRNRHEERGRRHLLISIPLPLELECSGLTSYWVRSLSGSSARKWLALTTQRAPTVPNPGRRQKVSPLLGTGGPMTLRTGGAGAGRGSIAALARPRRLPPPPPHLLLPPSGGGTTAVSALGCATLLCSGCFLPG
jgi:hypothetical protein